MGKPKNKSKGKDADNDSEPEAIDQMEEPESKPAVKASKKAKKKNKKDDDWEDDIAAELASLSVEVNKGNKDAEEEEDDVPVPTKKEKKKKKKQKQESDDEEDESTDTAVVNRGNKKAAFNMLMMEDEEEEEEKKQQSDSEEEVKEVEKPVKQQKKKEKKKKGKEKTAEEEDLDALLAEIDKPVEKQSKKSKKEKKKEAAAAEADENGTDEKEPTPEVEKVEPKVVTIDDLDDEDDDDRKKKKKKGKEKKDGEEEGEKDGEGAEEDGGTVKSAAQKKKEKKERERLKKIADKKKQAQKEGSKPADDKTEQTTSTGESVEKTTTETTEDKAGSGNEGEAETDGKKKKKKKKGEKEEPEKKKKKAPVAAIKEMLQRQKEEEERLKREEEERIRLEEEAHEARLEKKRLDEEKKAKKKEKEKERKARLKAEGKPVTAQQKQERLRAQQLLESMQAQGLIQKKDDQDDKEEKKKKRPIYVDKKKMKKKKQDEETQPGETPSPEETPVQTPMEEEAPALTPDTQEVEKAEIKDDWMDSSEEEEEEEKESSPEQEEATKIEIKDKSEVDEEDEEEDSDEEEDDDEDDDDDDDDETDSSDEDDEDLTPYERAERKLQKAHEKYEAARTVENLRAPVVCVLGHVDTGKTKILDKLRRTNVQDGEAGGITQQIGATNVPKYAILEKTTMCKEFQKKELKLPGLLIIDTPGHESFSNLRSRGSSLCDIAILVIDIMHGLEPQTIESINLLKARKTPFVVALNKIDRLYQWKPTPNSDVMNTIKKQGPMAKAEFDERSRKVITELAEQGLNAALFYENKNPKEYISLIPTSAHSGDGMGNLVALICDLTQTWLAKKVSYSEELHATVMEVKALPGLGTTIDVILVNGKLKEGDQIVIAGTEGPVVTQVRGLLMPQPMKEFRVKGQYDHHKEVIAAQGVKVIGKDLEKALAGLPLYVASNDDEVEYYKEELSAALKEVLNSIKCVERGVFVQASTLGSLEALLEFLRTSEIPYAGINIGPVHRKDIMRASVMLEHDTQWAVILAFDVKVEREAQEMADNLGVRIFTADIIYHLEDKFMKFRADLKKQKQEEFKHIAVFPCKLRVLPQYIFNSRDPIVMGVVVEAGVVRMGTPICVPSKEFVFLGHITSIEVNHKVQDFARKGQEVCIKIENIPSETPKLYGRHFDHTDMLVSRVSRASIDAVKNHFREEMTKPDWVVMLELKKMFQIL